MWMAAVARASTQIAIWSAPNLVVLRGRVIVTTSWRSAGLSLVQTAVGAGSHRWSAAQSVRPPDGIGDVLRACFREELDLGLADRGDRAHEGLPERVAQHVVGGEGGERGR